LRAAFIFRRDALESEEGARANYGAAPVRATLRASPER
jgi:hypothetical protein